MPWSESLTMTTDVIRRTDAATSAVIREQLSSVVREMPDGEGRLRSRIALAFAALSLPSPASAGISAAP